jgi:hypothetical protein
MWSAFHSFVHYRHVPEDFVIAIWNLSHRKSETLRDVFHIPDQPHLRDDILLDLYLKAMVEGLKEYDTPTICSTYNLFLTRYEKLHNIQSIIEFIPAPSWITRHR